MFWQKNSFLFLAGNPFGRKNCFVIFGGKFHFYGFGEKLYFHVLVGKLVITVFVEIFFLWVLAWHRSPETEDQKARGSR